MAKITSPREKIDMEAGKRHTVKISLCMVQRSLSNLHIRVAYFFSSGSSQPRNQSGGLLHCRQILYQLSHQGNPKDILLWSTDPLVVAGRLICSMACGLLLPWPEIEPMSPALQGRFLTTGPPGKSQLKVWLNLHLGKAWMLQIMAFILEELVTKNLPAH